MQSMTRMNSDISGERSMTPTNSSLPDGSKGLLSWLRRKLSSGGGHPEDEEGDGEDGQPQLLLPGGIHPIRGDVARFTSKSVVLTSGQQLPADMVLYCTGYTKQYNWLDGAITVRSCATQHQLVHSCQCCCRDCACNAGKYLS
jgi:hypothetical protein